MSQAAQFLETLSKVRVVRVSAQSKKGGGDGNYAGAGSVQVHRQDDFCLEIIEGGVGGGVQESSPPLRFSNHLRWSIHSESCLQFERMRTGAESVVLRLQVGDDGVWRTLNPHLCGADLYEVTAEARVGEILVTWKILGPQKAHLVLFEYKT